MNDNCINTYLLTYLLTNLLTYSIQHSPSWEANWFAASQEIPRILWNPKVHYPIHKFPSPVSILSQLNPVHTSTSHFLKIHLNIILPSTPGSPQWSLSLRFPHLNAVYVSPLPHMSYMLRPSHSSRFYHPHNSGWGVQNMEINYILYIIVNSIYSRWSAYRTKLDTAITKVITRGAK
jgi:hypothetical protein